jgi:hypothetical protein
LRKGEEHESNHLTDQAYPQATFWGINWSTWLFARYMGSKYPSDLWFLFLYFPFLTGIVHHSHCRWQRWVENLFQPHGALAGWDSEEMLGLVGLDNKNDLPLFTHTPAYLLR